MFENVFNPFRETVFLKEDSTMDTDLVKLKEIRDKIKNKENIDKDIKLIELGIKGESEIAFELKNANLGLVVLRDITIEHEGNTAQIDYVIISKGCIYLIECKNLIGNIYIDNKGQFTREYIYNGKKIKEGIYSPYTQAVRHKEILKKKWCSANNKFIRLIGDSMFEKNYKPLVVLSNPKSILYDRYAPKNIKSNVVRVDQLVRYIENDINNYDKDLLSKKKDMYATGQYFLNINITKKVNFYDKYKIKLESDNKNDSNIKFKSLEDKLLEYRKNKSIKMNVPAYYIFTNDELNRIIKLKPKTLDELKEIFSPIKVKCHGSEIIDLINNSE